jgi:hypothetical protein
MAYQSAAGDLNCWTGLADVTTASITWRRKATYSFSNLVPVEPAIAINDDGWVVAVDRFTPPGLSDTSLEWRLESRVGRLQNDGRILWFSAEVLDYGRQPSLRFDGDQVTEVHSTADGARRRQVRGALDRQRRKVRWRSPAPTQRQPFPRDTATLGNRQLGCSADAGGWIGCAFDNGPQQPARFRQLAFVEYQQGEDPASFRDALFFAAPASDKTAIQTARVAGLVARAWGFSDEDLPEPNPPQSPDPAAENMPATDDPTEPGYQIYMSGQDVAA